MTGFVVRQVDPVTSISLTYILSLSVVGVVRCGCGIRESLGRGGAGPSGVPDVSRRTDGTRSFLSSRLESRLRDRYET